MTITKPQKKVKSCANCKKPVDHLKLVYRHLNKLTPTQLDDIEKNLPSIKRSSLLLAYCERRSIINATNALIKIFNILDVKKGSQKPIKIKFNKWDNQNFR